MRLNSIALSVFMSALTSVILISCGGGGGGGLGSSAASDQQAPTAPTNLVLTDTFPGQVNLSWSPSSDNTGVAGYRIYRDGTFLKVVQGTTATDPGLNLGVQYCYKISAYDPAMNESQRSNETCITTYTYPTPDWTISTINGDESVSGNYIATALDSAGSLHMIYQDGATWDLKYATNASGVWTTTIIDSIGAGAYPSIAVDSSDKVHISYYDPDKAYLKYATNASGAWVIEVLDGNSGTAMGSGSAIGIDSKGKIHISYKEYYGTLRYITNASGAWVSTSIYMDQGSDNAAEMSLAIDSADNVHISCFNMDIMGADLKYATNKSGAWVISTVAGSAEVGRNTSIKVDAYGNAHILYRSNTSILSHATNASGTWVTEPVDNSRWIGEYSSLALDSSGNLHIAYTEGSDGFKYATNSSGEWRTDLVDQGNVGQYNSIAVDNSGKIHICYADLNSGGVKCAVGNKI